MAQTKRVQKKKTRYTKRARRLQKEAILSAIGIAIFFILLVSFHSKPQRYQLVIYQRDASYETVQYYTGFRSAKREMERLIAQGEYNPAILDENDRIVAIRYGIINFKTKTCGENTTYTLENGERGYTNGCYGADAAYLETDDAMNRVRFKQSGAVGWVDLNEIEIYNVDDPHMVQSINHYRKESNHLIHYGTTDLKSSDYALNIAIGISELELGDGPLYSYDGHYFYDSYPAMIEDYRSNTYTHSLNPTSPHYNYFQFLSHRSKSSYVSKDINWYIRDYLGFTAKPAAYPAQAHESELYEEGYSFVDAQNSYGVNAMMALALAINESGLGKSEIAITKHNLFGHAAYDIAPDESANGYQDVKSGIIVHASLFLNQGYLNPCDQSEEDATPLQCFNNSQSRYRGGYFGDKSTGMNTHYASDPYWGEKAAQYYERMDTILGGKDINRYELVILHQRAKTPMYAQNDTNSKIIYYSPDVEDYAMILLGTIEGQEVMGSSVWYKLQSDGVLNNARNAIVHQPENYHPNSDVVYVPAAYFMETQTENPS